MSYLDSVHEVFSALNSDSVRYLVVGGMAVAAHGHVRATNDIDMVVALDHQNALTAIESLTRIGFRPAVPVPAKQFADESARARWRSEKGMLVFQMRTGKPMDVPVDLFLTEPFDFERAYEHAVRAEVVPGVEIPVVPLDILLEMKEAAGRPKDQEDIRILRELNPEPPDSGP